MSTWQINNGIVSLETNEGSLYPLATDFFSNKGKDSFEYCGSLYESPEKSLNLSISKIGVPVKLRLQIASENITISLSANKSGHDYVASFANNRFMDYIIAGNRLHFLSGDYELISALLSKLNISSQSLSLSEYMDLTRELIKANIPFEDMVGATISDIKENTEHFAAKGLNATLFPYQDSGCNWLNFMVSNGCGCILGDEMGLGKTLQIIALFGAQKEKNPNAHFLVVCPVSLLENWKREIAKFYPSLSVLVHQGPKRTGDFKDLLSYDVIVISYSNTQSDLGMLNMINWSVIVLDEAQYIKTPSAKRAKTVKMLKKDVAIAVTGTPFENHMTDVWSIVDFVMPNYLGTLSSFEANFADDVESAINLERLIASANFFSSAFHSA